MEVNSSFILTGRVSTTFVNKNRISTPVQPANLMVLFWLMVFVVYLLGPIYLTPEVTLFTLTFIASHILCFMVGAIFLSRIVFFEGIFSRLHCLGYIPEKNLIRLVYITLAIGICGGVCSIWSKLSMLNVIAFDAISQLRSLRAQNLLEGEAVQSGLASAVAFLTYPAGFVGLVATIINYETMPKITKFLSATFVSIIVLLAFCAGGRSPILVLFIFIGTSCYIRNKLGKKFIPQSLMLKFSFISLMILFVAYSSYIWVVRANEAGLSTDAMLNHAETVWGAHPKAYLLQASEWIGNPGFTQTILGTTFYFIQSLSITERLLTSSYEIPVLYGAYQIDILAALFRALPGGAEFLKNGYGTLLDANIYGYFTGAWSGLYIDLGCFSFFAAMVWGFFAGRSWRNFKRNPNVLTGISYVFWIYSIFISFVSSPFGFSNSFMIFFWFMMFSLTSLLVTRYKFISST